MKEKVTTLLKHPLVTGSTLVFIASFLANILNWFFNLLIGGYHLLSVTDYGLYSSLLSLIIVIGILANTICSIVAKFAAQYKARNNSELIGNLFYGGFKVILFFAVFTFILLLASLFPVSSFLHVTDIRLLLLTFASIFFSILLTLPFGVFQGEMRLLVFSSLTILNPFLKIVLGIFFIFLGLKVFGVILGILLSTVIIYALAVFLVMQRYRKNTISKHINKQFYKEFRNYSIPFFLTTFGITILSNTDILFVRHYLSAEQAGLYAALSVMGKAIFYFISPIYFVFFPLIAQKKEKGEKLLGTLLLAFGVITIISLGLSFIYFFFPEIVLKVFFPAKEYAIVAKYLGIYSLYVFVFSIASLFNSFLLSINKTRIYLFNLLAAGGYIILINLFHANLYQIIGDLFTSSFLLFSLLIIYFNFNGRH